MRILRSEPTQIYVINIIKNLGLKVNEKIEVKSKRRTISYIIDMSAKQDPKINSSLHYYSNGLLQKTFAEAILGNVIARFSDDQMP